MGEMCLAYFQGKTLVKHMLDSIPHGQTTSWHRFNENNENFRESNLKYSNTLTLRVSPRSQDLKRHRSRSFAGGG